MRPAASPSSAATGKINDSRATRQREQMERTKGWGGMEPRTDEERLREPDQRSPIASDTRNERGPGQRDWGGNGGWSRIQGSAKRGVPGCVNT